VAEYVSANAGVVDLRSDTVTRPSPAMRAAMASAEVGDDVFGDDPSIIALQDRVAAMFGHQAALFTPSGSMANQIALQTLARPGEELLCDADAHLLAYEGGAGAAYGGLSSRTWGPAGAGIDVDAVARMIRVPGGYTVPTKILAVEQTHNLAGGAVIPVTTLARLSELALAHGLMFHCDGARIWNAHVATGVPLETYGRMFDSISVCLSKGLGAPVGSLLIGSAVRMEQARVIRKRLGGGMRQAGILAAAGLYALEHNLARLADDHRRAKRLHEALPGSLWGGTNIVYLPCADPRKVIADAASLGVLTVAGGAGQVRVITHLDVDDAAIDRAIEVLSRLLGVR
jgi:threonine aldolase